MEYTVIKAVRGMGLTISSNETTKTAVLVYAHQSDPLRQLGLNEFREKG
jgi:hypothetical protein